MTGNHIADLARCPFAPIEAPRPRSFIERATFTPKPDLAYRALLHLLTSNSVSSLAPLTVRSIMSDYGLGEALATSMAQDMWAYALELFLANGEIRPAQQAYLTTLQHVLNISHNAVRVVETAMARPRFTKAIIAAAIDGRLSPTSRVALNQLADRLAIDEPTAQSLFDAAERTLLDEAIRAALAKGVVAPDEADDILQRAAGVNIVLDPKTQQRLRSASDRWRWRFAPLEPVHPSTPLGVGEVCFLEQPTTWSEALTSPGTARVQLAPIDTGTLVVTDRRALFHGSAKSSNIEYKDIVKLTMFDDALRIRRHLAKSIYFMLPGDQVQRTATIILRARNGETTVPLGSTAPVGDERRIVTPPLAGPTLSAVSAVQGSSAPVPPSRSNPLVELSDLIGLASVKEEVSTLRNVVRVEHARRAAGLPVSTVTHHLSRVGTTARM